MLEILRDGVLIARIDEQAFRDLFFERSVAPTEPEPKGEPMTAPASATASTTPTKRKRTDKTRAGERRRKKAARALARARCHGGVPPTQDGTPAGHPQDTERDQSGTQSGTDALARSPIPSGNLVVSASEDREKIPNTLPPFPPESETGQTGRPADPTTGPKAGQEIGREGGTLFDLGVQTAPRLVAVRIRGILAAGMPAVMPPHVDAFQRVLDRLAEAGYTEADFVSLADAARDGLPGYRSAVALHPLLGRFEAGEYPAGGLKAALEKARSWRRRKGRERPVIVAPVAIAAKAASVPTVAPLVGREARARALIAKRDEEGS